MSYNPGGVAGNYIRYTTIYRNGQFVCSTNRCTPACCN